MKQLGQRIRYCFAASIEGDRSALQNPAVVLRKIARA
jgi:hypothetical protein